MSPGNWMLLHNAVVVGRPDLVYICALSFCSPVWARAKSWCKENAAWSWSPSILPIHPAHTISINAFDFPSGSLGCSCMLPQQQDIGSHLISSHRGEWFDPELALLRPYCSCTWSLSFVANCVTLMRSAWLNRIIFCTRFYCLIIILRAVASEMGGITASDNAEWSSFQWTLMWWTINQLKRATLKRSKLTTLFAC